MFAALIAGNLVNNHPIIHIKMDGNTSNTFPLFPNLGPYYVIDTDAIQKQISINKI